MAPRRNPFVGIALQTAAILLFTVMGALVRHLGPRVPIGEIVFARSFVALLPILLMLAWQGELRSGLRANRPLAHISRSITGVIAMFLNFAALTLIPLADATAIGFATPLFSVALAALFLGEVVRIYRWSAVIVGLVGVLVMLSPYLGAGNYSGASGFGALLAVAGSFMVAVAMTLVRHLARTETTASLVFYFSVVCAVGGLATLPWGWVVPSPGDLAALVATGILGGLGQILITESYRHAAAAVVAPFAYTAMIWSVAIGYFAFGEVPEAVVLAGAAIVIAAGLFVIWREWRLGIERAAERRAEGPPAGPTV